MNKIISRKYINNSYIIPYSSSSLCNCSCIDGQEYICSLIGFGSLANFIIITDNVIDFNYIQGIFSNKRFFSFIVPRDGIIKSVYSKITSSSNFGIIIGDTVTINIVVYRAKKGTFIYEPIVKIPFDPINTFPLFNVISANNDKLNIVIKEGDQILIAYTLTAINGKSYGITFYACGGISIE